MADLEKLKQAIRDLHGLDAVHLRSEPVSEVFKGKPAWIGSVEVFEARSGPSRVLCYAWSYDDNGEERFVAVLGKPPIDSARKAVQAFIADQWKKKQEGKT